MKADPAQWPTDPEYAARRHRLEEAVDATLVEARRRERLNEERPQ